MIALYLQHPEKMDLIDEYEALIESADKELVEIFTQHKYPTSSHYLGKGFLENVQDIVSEDEKFKDIQEIIVNTELTPLQFFNINSFFSPLTLIDRFQLVLEIFEKNSNSLESKLQIDLAKLKYNVIFEKQRYLKKMVGSMESIGGTERRGFAGTGELKIDVILGDYRKKEAILKSKLNKIKLDRSTRRKSRNKVESISISLVGYTNAGKSSFINILTKSTIKTEEKYFTTLGTTTRSFKFHDLPILITDTVGFIEELPTQLIDAFQSTLEESLTTDYVALVIDVSDPISDIERKMDTTTEILKELGINDEKLVLILNKIDKTPKQEVVWINEYFDSLETRARPRCFISAKIGDLDQFYKLLEQLCNVKKYQVILPLSFHDLKSELYTQFEVLNEITQLNNSTNNYETILELNTRKIEKFLKVIHKIESRCNKLNLKSSYIQISTT